MIYLSSEGAQWTRISSTKQRPEPPGTRTCTPICPLAGGRTTPSSRMFHCGQSLASASQIGVKYSLLHGDTRHPTGTDSNHIECPLSLDLLFNLLTLPQLTTAVRRLTHLDDVDSVASSSNLRRVRKVHPNTQPGARTRIERSSSQRLSGKTSSTSKMPPKTLISSLAAVSVGLSLNQIEGNSSRRTASEPGNTCWADIRLNICLPRFRNSHIKCVAHRHSGDSNHFLLVFSFLSSRSRRAARRARCWSTRLEKSSSVRTLMSLKNL